MNLLPRYGVQTFGFSPPKHWVLSRGEAAEEKSTKTTAKQGNIFDIMNFNEKYHPLGLQLFTRSPVSIMVKR